MPQIQLGLLHTITYTLNEIESEDRTKRKYLPFAVITMRHFLISSFMKYHLICNRSNTMCVTWWAGRPTFTPGWVGVRFIVFCIVFYISLFVLLSFFFCRLHFMSSIDSLCKTPLKYSNFSYFLILWSQHSEAYK